MATFVTSFPLTGNLTYALPVRQTVCQHTLGFASCRHGGNCDVFRCSLPTDLTNTDERARERQSEKELKSVSNQMLLETHG